MEYYEAPFTISDSVYGFVCLYRLINHQFTRHHHFGFEAAAYDIDILWM